MAERRMFAKKITESDAFLDMPSSTQMLYFHLSMNADDDGFVNNQKQIQRMCGASNDDFKLLVAKSFVILFESGIIVIKHWKMHNYIQSDRYRPTDYVDEKSMLGIKKNKAYALDENKMYTKCIQDVSVDKDSIDKDSIGKNSIDKNRIGKDNNTKKEKDVTNVTSEKKRQIFKPPSVEQVEEYCLERNNGIDAQSFVDFYDSKGWMIGKNKMKDWKAAVRTWERSRTREKEPQRTVYDEWRES